MNFKELRDKIIFTYLFILFYFYLLWLLTECETNANKAFLSPTLTIRIVSSGFEWGGWGIRKRCGCADFFFYGPGILTGIFKNYGWNII